MTYQPKKHLTEAELRRLLRVLKSQIWSRALDASGRLYDEANTRAWISTWAETLNQYDLRDPQ